MAVPKSSTSVPVEPISPTYAKPEINSNNFKEGKCSHLTSHNSRASLHLYLYQFFAIHPASSQQPLLILMHGYGVTTARQRKTRWSTEAVVAARWWAAQFVRL